MGDENPPDRPATLIGWENGHLLRHDRSLKLYSQGFSWACKEALFKIIKRAGE